MVALFLSGAETASGDYPPSPPSPLVPVAGVSSMREFMCGSNCDLAKCMCAVTIGIRSFCC